jgi:NitT/TauT family transport system substrate-binding protein
MYGLTLVTTQKFADENPETVRGVVAALNHGTKDTIADPDGALEVIKERDPMMKMDIEKIRLSLALDLTKTPHVVQSGLSVVDPKKLQFTIDSITDAYKLPAGPDPKTVYTEKFLPPLAERKI